MISNEINDEAMISDLVAGTDKLSHVTNFLLLQGEHIKGSSMYTKIGKIKLGGTQLYNMTWYVMLEIGSLNNAPPFKPFMLTEEHPSAHITPPRFPALSFSIGMCTISHFGSGSLIVTGGSNENIVLYSIMKYLSLIEDLRDDLGRQRYKVSNIRLSPINYVQSLILPFRIQLGKLVGWTYNPRKYPAAINNQIIPGASVTIFDSGAVNICGKILIDIENDIINKLVEICRENNAILDTNINQTNGHTRSFIQLLKVVHLSTDESHNKRRKV